MEFIIAILILLILWKLIGGGNPQSPAKENRIFPKLIDKQYLHGLFPFQIVGIEFIEYMKGRALIADEMGLGKTVQALGWLYANPELRPALVVCPASVKYNWAQETKRWLGETFCVVKGRNYPISDNRQIYIINYDILSQKSEKITQGWFRKSKESVTHHRNDIGDLGIKVVIIDECHYIKNEKTNRTKAVRTLCHDIEYIIALSGTPITSRPIEFFTILNLLKPDIFKNRDRFAEKYCGPKNHKQGVDYQGTKNPIKLNRLLSENVMIRRLKEDVLPDLPPKIISVIPVEISNQAQYDAAELKFALQLYADAVRPGEYLAHLSELRQLAAKGKVKTAIKWIEEYLAVEEKLVIFAVHRAIIDKLMDKFGTRCVKIDGSVSAAARHVAVERFQTDPDIQVFIGNIKAAGIGITLTKAKATCFLEFGWTPAEHQQAEDRVHRIGQSADSVMAYYLAARGTVDEDMMKVLDKKRQVLAQILDGGNVEKQSMLSELIEQLKYRIKTDEKIRSDI